MMSLIKIILVSLFFVHPANATLNEVDKTQVYNKNLLVNGGFENGKARWTASAGTFAVTTTNPMIGLVHATWDAAASADTLTSTAVAIPVGMYSRNGVVSCLVSTSSGTSTHEIQAYDGSNVLSESSVVSSSNPNRVVANFIFPSSGSISLRIYANADEPSGFSIDDCYLGPAEGYNFALGQGQDVFSAKVSSADAVTAENHDWINGNCTNATTGKATCTFQSGIFSASPNCQVTASDATDGRIATIESITSSAVIVNTTDDAGSLADIGFHLSCQKSGVDAPAQAFKPDAIANSWTGYHDHTCVWSTTSASLVLAAGDATCALTEVSNSNFGTVSTVSDGTGPQAAISFIPKRAGRYEVCATIIGYSDTDLSNNFRALSDGTNVIARSLFRHLSGGNNPLTLCGAVTASSVTATQVQVHMSRSSGTSSTGMVSAAASPGAAINWSIKQIDVQTPAPALVNSVTNTSSGVTGIEAANINCDAGSAITSQRGSWVSSVGNISGGACAVTLSGTFSSTPYCWAQPSAAFATTGLILSVAASSSTAVSVDCEDDASNACTSVDFNLFCLGAK